MPYRLGLMQLSIILYAIKKHFVKCFIKNGRNVYKNSIYKRNWQFSKEDIPIVRHRIKKHKKSTNRKPKRGEKEEK